MTYSFRYMMVHAFYQTLMILVSSYASVFLIFHGYSDGSIGMISSFACGLLFNRVTTP